MTLIHRKGIHELHLPDEMDADVKYKIARISANLHHAIHDLHLPDEMDAGVKARIAKIFRESANLQHAIDLQNAMDAGVKARIAREAANMVSVMNDISYKNAECPICERKFRGGWYHPADQKLHSHMRNGKAHRTFSQDIPWDTRHWF
jgi:hypothetical protein